MAYASVIEWTRTCQKKKTNEQTDDNKEIIRFFYQIALVIFFPIWKRRAHFVFEAFRIQVAAQSKLKKNKKQKQTNKTKNKRGNKLYRILRSFFQVTMLTFLLIKILIKGYSSYRQLLRTTQTQETITP